VASVETAFKTVLVGRIPWLAIVRGFHGSSLAHHSAISYSHLIAVWPLQSIFWLFELRESDRHV